MVQRLLVEVRGTVQGVGFRPYVHTLATSLGLEGFVQNRGSAVFIDIEGEAAALERFLDALAGRPPALARIESVRCRRAAPVRHGSRPQDRRPAAGFAIAPSDGAATPDTRVSPDVATCEACLAELFDPANRRFRHPFITCTGCGPRFTIVTGVPYDRPRTTMATFAMCVRCRREYEDPADRRFHAQPIACPHCGPTLAIRDGAAGRILAGDPVAVAVAALLDGHIVAIKGLGGYHLACDATSDAAVARLRQRKRREARPFAVMVPDAVAGRLDLDPAAHAALVSRERPIVLIDRRAWGPRAGALAAGVAPGSPAIGVMLPYTPLHHLILRAAGRPLVMTSGNAAGEPIAYEDGDAWTRLRGLADLFLTHDRPIHAPCDDSVVRVVAGGPTPIRRARGFVPAPIRLPRAAAAPTLAVGGHLKNTVCVAAGHRAWLSPHVGDLDGAAAYRALGDTVARSLDLLQVQPEVVVHDRHPDYLSTRFAEEFPAGLRLAVQHHHAHVLACLAEHGVAEPAIGVVFDGAGLGEDGAVWGGEFLLVEGADVRRLAHVAYVPLPGGDAAAREPWRAALAHLVCAGAGSHPGLESLRWADVSPRAVDLVRQMIARGVNAPPTSSVGRLFDAVASLVGLRQRVAFEGQAAMELEAVAVGPADRGYGLDLERTSDPWTVHAAPLVRAVARDVAAGVPREAIAASFHDAVAAMIADVASALARRAGTRHVALTGGVFQNARLTSAAAVRLAAAGLPPLLHRQVPCNDGGLSLGQAAYAAHALARRAPLPERAVCA